MNWGDILAALVIMCVLIAISIISTVIMNIIVYVIKERKRIKREKRMRGLPWWIG